MSDVVSIQEQSQRSFFQWHVYLIMKKKQLEATLADAGYRPEVVREIEVDLPPVVDSDELTLIKNIGLPVPENLSAYDLPNQEHIEGIRFFFHASPAFDNEHDYILGFVRQLVDGRYEHRELIRVNSTDRDYLNTAMTRFNQASTSYAIPLVLNAAIVWATFHGAVVMDWVSVSSRLLGADSETSDTTEWFKDAVDIPESSKKKRRGIKRNGRSLYGSSD